MSARLARTRPAAGILVLAALLSGATAPTEAASSAPARTYLILPFDDGAPDGSRDWMREAMALSLSEYFLGAGQQVVDRETRLGLADELGFPGGASLTLASSLRMGRTLRARNEEPRPDRLVVGRFSLDQGHLVLSARVLDLVGNRAAPWKEVEGGLTELIRMQRSLAQSLLRSDGLSGENLAAAADDAGSGSGFPLVAFENYARALIETDPGRQLGLFRRASEQSPGYPKACYQLGRLLARSGKRGEAETALRRASAEPVPYAAEYHALLGALYLAGGRLSEAEREVEKSFALRETAGGWILRAHIARASGRSDEARRALQRAEALDPGNPEIENLRKVLAKDESARP